ncbi:MAG: GNAT family N-acetyltransferase [Clostridia bacterium]|nr:GNAT family N-acetyltransferase [Clostridia bacterium]
MNLSYKIAEEKDLEACCEVEKATTPKMLYIKDAWSHYMATKGALVCVIDKDENDKIIGIGRMTVMPDNMGWLECLRIHPDYQGKGAGNIIWNVWEKLAEDMKLKGLSMFTGTKNIASNHLAEKHNVFTSGSHKPYTLSDFSGGNRHDFAPVNWERAEKLILPKKDEYDNYITLNRTFFRINRENIRYFADRGFVFEDKLTGDFAVIGSRFQHSEVLYLMMCGGNTENCVDFAKNLACALGVKQLCCILSENNKNLPDELVKLGFEKAEITYITKEGVY